MRSRSASRTSFSSEPRLPYDHLPRRRSPALNQILEHFIDQSARFIHLYLRATDTMIKAQTEHAEIYMACKSREPDVLERVILDHVRQTLALLNESAFQSLKA